MKHPQFELIRQWADERGLYEKGDPVTQFAKLSEEQGELARALLKKDLFASMDAIGDMVVVLTNLVELISDDHGFPVNEKLTIERCIESAWNVIKDRKGEMKNGTFVKSEDQI